MSKANHPSADKFRKVEACKYEYAGSGYYVERMANGSWDAYLPSAFGARLWQSPAHSSRNSAARAISAERRRVGRAVKAAAGMNQSSQGERMNTSSAGECFACGRPLTNPYQVTCADDQQVTVGSECFAHIRRGHDDGWQPPKGGPRLYLLRCQPGRK